MVGTASVMGDQSDASYSSSDDLFCLQMQAKSAKDNTKEEQTTTFGYQYRIQIEASQKENQVSQGQN